MNIGTGKDIPPFYSVLFFGGFEYIKKVKEVLIASINQTPASIKKSVILDNVNDMIKRGYVTDKRPNPKARKRLKAKQINAGK